MSRTSPSMLYDAHGKPVTLGRSLGAGGEARVYALTSAPGSVAKIYHEVRTKPQAEKLAAMASVVGRELLQVAAWPTGTLHVRPHGEITGLIMPLVDGHRELHALYSPAQRRQTFPHASWEFLLHVSLNVARALAVVHAAGHVVGDVNQKNVVVSDEGLVRLLDCDSFQITAGGRRFPCEVGIADFTPPELHGQSFKGVIRTQNHDCFGLAILIFHLLFMGRHPFTGIFQKGRADMPTERAIREGRYAYGIGAAQFQMEAPPHSLLPAAGATAEVAGLFERAFAPQGSAATRPPAAEWVAGLGRMQKQLRRCQSHRGHVFVGSNCPWCAIERGGGPDFFLTLAASPAPGATAGAVWNLDDLLRRASAIQEPPAAPVLRHPAAKAGVASQVRSTAAHRVVAVLLYAVAVVCFFNMFQTGILFFAMLACFIAGNVMRKKAAAPRIDPALSDTLAQAAKAHEDSYSEWLRDVDAPAKKLSEAQKALGTKQQQYRNLPGEHREARQRLPMHQRSRQLADHLHRFYVRNSRIDGVGAGLKQTLLSFGIETAADVTRSRVSMVPGFGPTRTAALVAWRNAVEARFKFDPSIPISPAEYAAVDSQYAVMRQKLEREMQILLAEMQSYSTRANGAAQRLRPELLRTADCLAIAKAQAGMH